MSFFVYLLYFPYYPGFLIAACTTVLLREAIKQMQVYVSYISTVFISINYSFLDLAVSVFDLVVSVLALVVFAFDSAVLVLALEALDFDSVVLALGKETNPKNLEV